MRFRRVWAAKALAKAPVQITLLDRRTHHLFQPLLYQVATAALNPGDIAYPIRSIVKKQKNVRVLLAEARAINPVERKAVLDDGELTYDYLVVATGATHSYFGKDSWAPLAPGLKSVEDALEIRRRVFLAYDAAEREHEDDVSARGSRSWWWAPARPASSSPARWARSACIRWRATSAASIPRRCGCCSSRAATACSAPTRPTSPRRARSRSRSERSRCGSTPR